MKRKILPFMAFKLKVQDKKVNPNPELDSVSQVMECLEMYRRYSPERAYTEQYQ